MKTLLVVGLALGVLLAGAVGCGGDSTDTASEPIAPPAVTPPVERVPPFEVLEVEDNYHPQDRSMLFSRKVRIGLRTALSVADMNTAVRVACERSFSGADTRSGKPPQKLDLWAYIAEPGRPIAGPIAYVHRNPGDGQACSAPIDPVAIERWRKPAQTLRGRTEMERYRVYEAEYRAGTAETSKARIRQQEAAMKALGVSDQEKTAIMVEQSEMNWEISDPVPWKDNWYAKHGM